MYMSTPGEKYHVVCHLNNTIKKVAEKFKFIRILHGLWQRLGAHFHCNTQQILKVRESFRFL